MNKETLREYPQEMKADLFYRLMANVQKADAEECAEILETIDHLRYEAFFERFEGKQFETEAMKNVWTDRDDRISAAEVS